MIYECTLFFNELKLLDLKLAEELDFVDQFVIVESNQTFTCNKKPLLLKNNSKYTHPKIKLIFLEDQFTADNAWINEKLQRDTALPNFTTEDIMIVSDIDEIINKEELPRLVDLTKESGYLKLNCNRCFYKINLLAGKWYAPYMVSGEFLDKIKDFEEVSLDLLRKRDVSVAKVDILGWHFGYLLSKEEIALKLKSFSHTELNTPEYTSLESIQNKIDNMLCPVGIDKLYARDIDSDYPSSILNNLDDWKGFIYENLGSSKNS